MFVGIGVNQHVIAHPGNIIFSDHGIQSRYLLYTSVSDQLFFNGSGPKAESGFESGSGGTGKRFFFEFFFFTFWMILKSSKNICFSSKCFYSSRKWKKNLKKGIFSLTPRIRILFLRIPDPLHCYTWFKSNDILSVSLVSKYRYQYDSH